MRNLKRILGIVLGVSMLVSTVYSDTMIVRAGALNDVYESEQVINENVETTSETQDVSVRGQELIDILDGVSETEDIADSNETTEDKETETDENIVPVIEENAGDTEEEDVNIEEDNTETDSEEAVEEIETATDYNATIGLPVFDIEHIAWENNYKLTWDAVDDADHYDVVLVFQDSASAAEKWVNENYMKKWSSLESIAVKGDKILAAKFTTETTSLDIEWIFAEKDFLSACAGDRTWFYSGWITAIGSNGTTELSKPTKIHSQAGCRNSGLRPSLDTPLYRCEAGGIVWEPVPFATEYCVEMTFGDPNRPDSPKTYEHLTTCHLDGVLTGVRPTTAGDMGGANITIRAFDKTNRRHASKVSFRYESRSAKITNLTYNRVSGMLTWDSTGEIDKYTVRVYETTLYGTETAVFTDRTTNTSYDLSAYEQKPGVQYYVTVSGHKNDTLVTQIAYTERFCDGYSLECVNLEHGTAYIGDPSDQVFVQRAAESESLIINIRPEFEAGYDIKSIRKVGDFKLTRLNKYQYKVSQGHGRCLIEPEYEPLSMRITSRTLVDGKIPKSKALSAIDFSFGDDNYLKVGVVNWLDSNKDSISKETAAEAGETYYCKIVLVSETERVYTPSTNIILPNNVSLESFKYLDNQPRVYEIILELSTDIKETRRVDFICNGSIYKTKVTDSSFFEWRVTKPEDPTTTSAYSGYEFGGWYYDKECTIPFVFDSQDMSPQITEDTSVYAKLTKIVTHKVLFNSRIPGNVTKTVTVTEPGKVSLTAAPILGNCADYILGDWYMDPLYQYKYDFDEPVTRDLTLFLKWEYKLADSCEHAAKAKCNATAPTCETNGTIEHYVCSYCGQRFLKNTKGEYVPVWNNNDLVIVALGHDFTNYRKDALPETCAHPGTETAVCNRAGCNQTDERICESNVRSHSVDPFYSTSPFSRSIEGHWKTCYVCLAKVDFAEHVDSNNDHKCDVCDQDLPTVGGMMIEGLEPDAWHENNVYTGKPIKPAVEVYVGSKLLKEGKDYSVSCKNNVNACDSDAKNSKGKSIAPTITVKGKGNYSGTVSAKFTILQREMTDFNTSASDLYLKYTGKNLKVAPKVSVNGRKLTYKKDFILVDESDKEVNVFKNEGIYKVRPYGIGNYCDAFETAEKTNFINIVVTKSKLIDKLRVSIPTQKYQDGWQVRPTNFVVYDGTKKLDDTCIEVVGYGANDKIGKGTITLKAKNGYEGVKTYSFNIKGGKSLKAKSVKVDLASKNLIYTGMEITPEPVVSYDGQTLIKDVHYTLEYKKNKNVGTATVVVKGKGEYVDSKSTTFKISAYNAYNDSLNKISITELDNFTKIYVSGGVKVAPQVYFKGVQLKKGKDYTLSHKNYNLVASKYAAKAPTVTIKFKGNLKGTISRTYSIVASDLEGIRLAGGIQVPDRPASDWKQPSVSIVDANGKKLSAKTDYTVVGYYKDRACTQLFTNSDASVGTVVYIKINGKGKYTSGVVMPYNLMKYSFGKAVITKTFTSKAYTGEEIKLETGDIKVTYLGDILTENTDYIITDYKNNISKGTASVTIKGIGSYAGQKVITFKIGARKVKWWSTLFNL